MITKLSVRNYKSLLSLDIELGRITVFIGANGAGKSNILEALALASAAANDKLDNEFLSTRGIRVTDDPRLMRSGFKEENCTQNIKISLSTTTAEPVHYELTHNSDESYSSWKNVDSAATTYQEIDSARVYLNKLLKDTPGVPETITFNEKSKDKITLSEAEYFLKTFNKWLKMSEGHLKPSNVKRFLIYSPEYSTLRTFEEEGQILPLGIRGEGLLKLITFIGSHHPDILADLKEQMDCLDWFSDFEVPSNPSLNERTLQIKDRYLHESIAYFNQRSANEGFLFLLFYFCLFLSNDTPPFFAVDNIDASLNPKLGHELVKTLTRLAKEKSKQAIFTTHNPAILDGLNLHDEEQRLFVVKRNRKGHTQVQRVMPPHVEEGQVPVRLSEAFLRGYIGGLPKNF